MADSKKEMTYGKIYKITKGQFNEIQRKEGRRFYGKRVALGEVDGVPVYTFTSPVVRTDRNVPCFAYLETIRQGLSEVFTDTSELVMDTYLYKKVIWKSEDYQVLSFVRNSEHAVKLGDMVSGDITEAKISKSVTRLVDLGLLVQDGRSVRSGHALTAMEAVVYTKREMR